MALYNRGFNLTSAQRTRWRVASATHMRHGQNAKCRTPARAWPARVAGRLVTNIGHSQNPERAWPAREQAGKKSSLLPCARARVELAKEIKGDNVTFNSKTCARWRVAAWQPVASWKKIQLVDTRQHRAG